MWRAITEADLLESLSSPELEGYRNSAKAQGQDDPATVSIERVTGTIRGRIAANKANTLGAEGTIPEMLIEAAVDLIAVRIIKRVGGRISDARKAAAEAADKLLSDVAAGTFAIEQPDVVTEEKISAPSPSVSPRPLKYTRDDQDGM